MRKIKNGRELMDKIGIEEFDYITRITTTVLGNALIYIQKHGLLEDFTKDFSKDVKWVIGGLFKTMKEKGASEK